jgi:hypothetical protein
MHENPARLGGEEEWEPCPGADDVAQIDTPETKSGALFRFVELLELTASLAIVAISIGIMFLMFRDVPMLSC